MAVNSPILPAEFSASFIEELAETMSESPCEIAEPAGSMFMNLIIIGPDSSKAHCL